MIVTIAAPAKTDTRKNFERKMIWQNIATFIKLEDGRNQSVSDTKKLLGIDEAQLLDLVNAGELVLRRQNNRLCVSWISLAHFVKD